jgi:MFS transporter, ACS family, hexuronate transporter
LIWECPEFLASLVLVRLVIARIDEVLTKTAVSSSPGHAPALARSAVFLLIALLLGETTVNFIDRQVLSVLAPTLREEFHLSNSAYAWIVNAFQITYAIMYTVAGRVLDRIGVGRGLTLGVVWWSIAGMLTSFARGPWSLGALRSLLAVGESAAWPAFAKAVATWVPKESRTLAIGICNSGSSLGAMFAPYLVATVTAKWGWRSAFLVTGLIGFVWVALFQWFRVTHPEMAQAEKANIAAAASVSWGQLASYRQTWVIFVCRFLADPMWFFFVYWIPPFLASQRGLNLPTIGLVAGIPFLAADIGNFAAGYLTMYLQKRGWTVNRTRKTLMAAAALLSPIGILAVFSTTLFWTMTFLSIAIFCWMFWSVAVHSLAGDYFPARAVGSVYGIAGTGSTIGSAIATWGIGALVDSTQNYTLAFIGISALMPIALVIGFTLMRQVEPVQGLSE